MWTSWKPKRRQPKVTIEPSPVQEVSFALRRDAPVVEIELDCGDAYAASVFYDELTSSMRDRGEMHFHFATPEAMLHRLNMRHLSASRRLSTMALFTFSTVAALEGLAIFLHNGALTGVGMALLISGWVLYWQGRKHLKMARQGSANIEEQTETDKANDNEAKQ